jgi:hypothetical protein
MTVPIRLTLYISFIAPIICPTTTLPAPFKPLSLLLKSSPFLLRASQQPWLLLEGGN